MDGGRFRGVTWGRTAALLLAGAMLVAVAGCAQEPRQPAAPQEPPAPTAVILASTTSTEDSGLFDVLIPAFEAANPEFDMSVVAVGTGQAFEIGRAKDADVLLVHAKADEEEFVAQGYGTERADVMYNDFVIVGPAADPAGIKGMEKAAEALQKIGAEGQIFASRGDDSGTHRRELKLWASVDTTPTGEWYQSIGQGMGDTLIFTNERLGYTLSDRATYLSMIDKLELDILVEGDKALLNQYGVIPVTDAANPEGAQAFFDWILSPEAQAVIEEFGVEEFGEPLFIPNAS